MRLSFAVMLLVAAATQINAAVTPNAAVAACTPGSSGLGKGDGYKGYCCKDQSDCIDDCVKGFVYTIILLKYLKVIWILT